ncbi:MAG: hypothetical protein ACT4PO_05840 [Actinomycetota bacterium]
MKIIYDGPHTTVDVPAANLVDVARGEVVEVPDEIAASLLEQSTWRKAKAPKGGDD